MNRPLLTPATSEIGIDRADSEAIQSQIARQIREFVLSGRLRPQAKLPSTRSMAEDLKVARATVVEAYEQLLSEGYIEARKGSGTRVAAELPEALLNSSPARLSTGKPHREKGREPAKPFRSGLVDWEHFPHDEWGRLLGRFWRNPPIAMLEHNDAFGWLPLREAIARHLYEWRGISCEASEVIMTAGGMDAFDLINRSIFKAGDKIWMEEPGYPTARRVFSMGGVKTVAVPVDREGIMVVKGRERAGNARGAFVTPARQYPTGVTMPLSRRLELLDWADEAKAIIIEDDYDSEYRYVGPALAGAHEPRPQGAGDLFRQLLKSFFTAAAAGLHRRSEVSRRTFPRRAPGPWRAAIADGPARPVRVHDVRNFRHPHPPHAKNLRGAARGPDRSSGRKQALHHRRLALGPHASAAPEAG